MSDLYNKRGVSANKEEVHSAVKNLDKGLYEKSFCQIFPDYLAGDNTYCNLMSSDGTGTKSILAYLFWREFNDLSVWRNIAIDALVMNLDDLLCVGATGPFLYSSVINRNKHLIDGKVIKNIIEGAQEFINTMEKEGVFIKYTGGETADLGDSVRTITIDGSMTTRMQRSKVIQTKNIQENDVIVGFSSFGKANYENQYNSGIGSNGLTSARHDILNSYYKKKYPESFDSNTDRSVLYSGTKKLEDSLLNDPNHLTVGSALLSPTRSYAPLVSRVLKEMKNDIHSIIHCTGGGQTKVLHFINNIKIVKNNLFAPPPLFQLIQKESNADWKEMYTVFNMGHRLEMYLPENKTKELIDISNYYNIKAQIIGHVESFDKKELIIESDKGKFIYH